MKFTSVAQTSKPTLSSRRREQRKFFTPFILFAVALCALCAWSTHAETGTSQGLSADDKEFLQKAAQGGMTEVAMGKLAEEKGTTPEIKSFGKMMVKDHGKINADVAALAKKKGVSLPSSLDEKHQAKVDKLGKLSGKDFDAAYLAAMATMHQKDLAAFTEERAETSDADLKAALDKASPVVKSHIEHLKTMPAKS